jgi:hypothetical protein
VDDDSSLEAVAHQSGVAVAPRLRQKTFTITKSAATVMSTEALEAAWETMKAQALTDLLDEHGWRLTFDTYHDGGADATFGRWTLEETA